MKLYNFTLNGEHSKDQVIEFLNGMVWQETETTEQNRPFHSNRICLSDDKTVALWYDFGADYYFFEELSQ